MSGKLTIIRLKNNPKSATGRRRRRPLKRTPAARRPRPKKTVARRTGWLVEVMHEKNSLYRFRYWSGRKLVTTRKGAQHYSTEGAAHAAAKQIIARLSADYRFARAVPA